MQRAYASASVGVGLASQRATAASLYRRLAAAIRATPSLNTRHVFGYSARAIPNCGESPDSAALRSRHPRPHAHALPYRPWKCPGPRAGIRIFPCLGETVPSSTSRRLHAVEHGQEKKCEVEGHIRRSPDLKLQNEFLPQVQSSTLHQHPATESSRKPAAMYSLPTAASWAIRRHNETAPRVLREIWQSRQYRRCSANRSRKLRRTL